MFSFIKNIFISKPKIAVLGCGWLGMPLAKAFMEAGYKVNGSTTRPQKKMSLESMGLDKVIVGKLSPHWDGDSLQELQELLDVEFVILNFPPGKDTDEYFHMNQMSEVVKFLKPHTKVIYTSSTSIYQETGKIVYESDIVDAESASHLKIARAEELLKNRLDVRLCILRCGGLTGWDRNLGKYFAGKINLAEGDSPVNLVHGQDVVNAILHVVKKNLFGTIYNVVSPCHPTKREYYSDLCRKSEMLPPQFVDIVENQKYKIVNCDKIINTGFKFMYPDPMSYDYEVVSPISTT